MFYDVVATKAKEDNKIGILCSNCNIQNHSIRPSLKSHGYYDRNRQKAGHNEYFLNRLKNGAKKVPISFANSSTKKRRLRQPKVHKIQYSGTKRVSSSSLDKGMYSNLDGSSLDNVISPYASKSNVNSKRTSHKAINSKKNSSSKIKNVSRQLQERFKITSNFLNRLKDIKSNRKARGSTPPSKQNSNKISLLIKSKKHTTNVIHIENFINSKPSISPSGSLQEGRPQNEQIYKNFEYLNGKLNSHETRKSELRDNNDRRRIKKHSALGLQNYKK